MSHQVLLSCRKQRSAGSRSSELIHNEFKVFWNMAAGAWEDLSVNALHSVTTSLEMGNISNDSDLKHTTKLLSCCLLIFCQKSWGQVPQVTD